MVETSQFTKLVRHLSSSERRKILNDIENAVTIKQDSLAYHHESSYFSPLEEEYEKFSLLEKIILKILELLGLGDRASLTEKKLMSRASRQLIVKHSCYLGVRKRTVSSEFYTLVKHLQDYSQFFAPPLAHCLGAGKQDFYILLGRLRFPIIFEQMDKKLDPWAVEKVHSHMGPSEISSVLQEELEFHLNKISKNERALMMEQTKIIHLIYQFSLFPFQKILSQYLSSEDGDLLPASLDSMIGPIKGLIDLILSFSQPPEIEVLEAIILYHYQEKLLVSDKLLEELLKENLEKSNLFFEQVRWASKAIDWKQFAVFLTNNPYYEVKSLGGGEDWFYFFKQYWQERIRESGKIFLREKMIEDFVDDLLGTWGLRFQGFPYYDSSNKNAIFAYSLGLLVLFYKELFQKKIYLILRIISIDGIFYKKDNKKNFDATFEGLKKVQDRFSWFELFLSPKGEGGLGLEKIKKKVCENEQIRARDIKGAYLNINRDCITIIEESFSLFDEMGRLLNGIILGNGGAYDTLSNYAELGGHKNDELRETILKTSDEIQKTMHYLKDIFRLEKENFENYKKNPI